MLATIGNNLISKLKPLNKQYDVRDSKLIGFLIRVNPSGKMVYVCKYKRGKRINIGKVGVLTPPQARDKAREILGDIVKGVEPKFKKINKSICFKDHINFDYRVWVETNRKDGKNTLKRICANFFKDFGTKRLDEITIWMIERLCCPAYQKARKHVGTFRVLFEKIRVLIEYTVWKSFKHLLIFIGDPESRSAPDQIEWLSA